MKKLIVIACMMGISLLTYARPGFAYHIPAPHHGPRVLPPPHHHYHRHHCIGPFVGGVVGGLIGSTVINSIRPAPTIIVQNSAPTQVWVEGRYVQQIVNGIVTTVWQPGHWETVIR